MRIAILGYGKMGRQVEEIALAQNHEVVLKISSQNISELTLENLKRADVAIEFSRPDAVLENIKLCFDAAVPIVVGTTGWYNNMDEIKTLCEKKNGSLLYASNFSIGVNIFFKINHMLAQLMQNKNYQAAIEETHHTQKLDRPSGTAITLANDIISENKNYKKWSLQHEQNSLHINSIRKENVTGTHIVSWQNEIDKIEIKHEAFSRKGFAMGALLAAQWIIGKKGFFTMNDVLEI